MDETSPRKLLILDLDETLIYVPDAPLARPGDFLIDALTAYKRPHVDVFLNVCRQEFETAVWSSAAPDYVARIVSHLFPEPLAFVWDASRCTPRIDPETGERAWRKNLSKVQRLGYAPETIIAVDDSPEKWESGYGNLVRVAPFLGDPEDDELPALLLYLDDLRGEENIRAVEKRGWRRLIDARRNETP